MRHSCLTTQCELAPAEVNFFFALCSASYFERQSFYLIISSLEKKKTQILSHHFILREKGIPIFSRDQDLLGYIRVILASLE